MSIDTSSRLLFVAFLLMMAGMPRIEGKGQRRQRGQVRGLHSRRVQSRTYTEPLLPGPTDGTEVVNLVNRPIPPPKCVRSGGKGCGPLEIGKGTQPEYPDKTQPE